MSFASEGELFLGPAGHSQGRELKAKNGSNFLPRLACEETIKMGLMKRTKFAHQEVWL